MRSDLSVVLTQENARIQAVDTPCQEANPAQRPSDSASPFGTMLAPPLSVEGCRLPLTWIVFVGEHMALLFS